MGIQIGQVSLVLAVLTAALCASAPAAAQEPAAQDAKQAAGRCGSGRYWNAALRRCSDCSRCIGPGREVTLRPCTETRDAHCGAIADLPIDWAWLHSQAHGQGPSPHHDHKAEHAAQAPRSRKKGVVGVHVHERINTLSEAESLLRDELRHMPLAPRTLPMPVQRHGALVDFGDDYIVPSKKLHRQRKPVHRVTTPKPFGEYDDLTDFGASGDSHVNLSDDEDLDVALWRRIHANRVPPTAASTSTTTPPPVTSTTPTTTTLNLVEDFIVEKEEVEPRAEVDVVATTQTFSTVETLVWDWQAGVLVAAVCACLLFFVVAAIYSCQHALHFKKLKKHLDADMEEISARLTLMAGMGSENLHDASAQTSVVTTSEKDAFPARRGDHLLAGRLQNDYCLAALPRKTRV